jgi:predicted carbohydrate-binding protein with CBM5 and CBM33 domain
MSSARDRLMKKMAMLLLSLALVLTGVAGCAASSAESNDQVTLTAARTGQRVLLTLRNGSATPVSYNLCSSTLQRGLSWEAVETDEVCTMELRTLEPGGTATFEKTLPSELRSGEYRYVTNAGAENKSMMVESNPFRVD